MKKLFFTKDELINNINFTEDDYKKAAESNGANASFAEFIESVMEATSEWDGSLAFATFLAEDAFDKIK